MPRSIGSNLVAIAVLFALSLTAQGQGTKSLPGGAEEAPPAQRLAQLVSLCEECHGPGGVSDRPDVPSLAGRDADTLFAEIERFYFYERVCPDVPVDEADAAQGHMSMCDVTNGLSRGEAVALARHFEAQTP